MKPAAIALTVLIGGTILGSLAIAFGYIAYADSTNYFAAKARPGCGWCSATGRSAVSITGTIAAVVTFKFSDRRPR